jgi:phospholipid/cholesterol/gamma-HCH transport system substrate-binding protein
MTNSVRRRTFEWRQARVVALIVIGALLLVYGMIRVGDVFDVFATRYEVVTLIPSVLGLREGAPVTLAGQRIGQVKKIEFIPVHAKTGANNLAVTLAIADDVKDQIRADSRAFLRTQGLLGDKLVDIEPGTPGAAILQPGDTLEAGRSLDLESFLTQAAAALDTANLIVADLRFMTHGIAGGTGTVGRLLNDEQLYQRMVDATEGLQSTLRHINDSKGTLGRLIRDPLLYERMGSAVGRVDSLGTMLLYGSNSISRLLRTDSLYTNLLGTTASADSAMSNLQAFVQGITAGQGSFQRLMTDPQLYDQFLKAVVDLQTLIQAVRTDPERFKPNIRVDIF